MRFLLPFLNFEGGAVPRDVDSYRAYRSATIDFLHARNARIDAWAREHLGGTEQE